MARDGMIVTAQDALRCALVISLGLRAEADLAELARARRDAHAEAAARERAGAFRDLALASASATPITPR